MSLETCSVRLCRKPAISSSPITSQALCSLHLQTDMSKIETLEISVAERIAYFRKYTTPLRLMQQRLTSDLQCLDDNFNALRDSLDKYQKELVDLITQQHDQLLDSLTTLSDLDDFERDLKSAKGQNDVRQAFLLNESVDKSLETLQLDSKLVCIDEETQQVKIVAYPDVNMKIRDLQACVQLELFHLQCKIALLDIRKSENEMNVTGTKVKFDGEAVCAAMCSNTHGFAIDESGSIIRAQTGQDFANQHNVPQPCAFVAINSAMQHVSSSSTDSESSQCDEQDVHKIMLVCADSQVSATLTSSWDESLPIVDLHCDDSRQKLFVAQADSITVTNLSGISESKISLSHLHDEAKELYCICGDCDKLYVLSELNNGNQVIFGLAIGTAEVQLQIPVPTTCNLSLSLQTSIAVRDRMLIVSDAEDVFTICSITGHLLNSEKFDSNMSFSVLGFNDDSFSHKDLVKILPIISYSRLSGLTTRSFLSKSIRFFILERSSNHCVSLMMMASDIGILRQQF